MSAYLIASYDVKDNTTYQKYNPGSIGIIKESIDKYGGNVLVATNESIWLADSRNMVVVIEFPDMKSAQAWQEDSDYVGVKKYRLASTIKRFEVIAPSLSQPS